MSAKIAKRSNIKISIVKKIKKQSIHIVKQKRSKILENRRI
jgi:hypothetical protein